MRLKKLRRTLALPVTGYATSVMGVLLVALLLWPFYSQLRGITAMTALVIVLLVAIKWGVGPALAASLLGALCVNFYFVPPILKFAFHLTGEEDVLALVGFLVTSIAVGRLSARAHRRVRENQKLNEQLQEAFQQSSQLEAVRQSEQLKSALLDTVTHDLRTPLTSIKAAASALLAGQASTESVGLSAGSRERFLEIIVQQSDRLNHFIEGMLELAKVRLGNLDAPHSAMPLEEILSAALARADDLLSRHQVMVECNEGLLASVSPKAVAQVIFSLLENAAKYAPQQSGIKISGAATEAGMLQVSVDDDGPGIPPEIRVRVFEKFFR